jgi:hypothetical protein
MESSCSAYSGSNVPSQQESISARALLNRLYGGTSKQHDEGRSMDKKLQHQYGGTGKDDESVETRPR